VVQTRGVSSTGLGEAELPAPARRRYRTPLERRRLTLAAAVVLVAALVGSLSVVLHDGPAYTVLSDRGVRVDVPVDPSLSPLRARIVAVAESQLGYVTDPADSYCNKYSAYWRAGSASCGNADLAEEWCADFAAWVWQRAGAAVTYGYSAGQIDGASASFYEWGLAHHTWHAAGSGYLPQPGDVAVYGLDTANVTAVHVAIVVGVVPGARGPIAVNGDGDLTGFSVVEVRADEYEADIHPSGAPLSGYVAPTPA
jgi:hypothetical protein